MTELLPPEYATRFGAVEEQVRTACLAAHRPRSEVTIVGVTKEQPAESIGAWRAWCEARGEVPHVGESYVQELRAKAPLLSSAVVHYIGRLQRNKVLDAVRFASIIESVHSAELANAIDAAAARLAVRPVILLQVNISGDEQKAGFSPAGISAQAVALARQLGHVEIGGVMTITRYYEDREKVRPDFERLAALAHEVEGALRREGVSSGKRFEISMGMSQDFDLAIKAGATLVRIGTALFGERPARPPGG